MLLAALVLGLLIWSAPAHAGGVPVTWCGGAEETSKDRPDTVNGLQIHVVYAYASDTPNRFAALASGIATDVAAVAAWWQGQDSTRVPRFDLATFAGCATTYGALDITVVQLPRAGAEYQANATTVDRIQDDLNAMGYGNGDKKTLVFYDGPYDAPQNCGKGVTGFVDGGKNGYAVMFLAACSAVVGTGVGDIGLTVAHELIHALNVLPVPFPNPGPPNVCGTSQGGAEDLGHPCDSASDMMFPTSNPGDTFANQVLDVGNDDYYNHPGGWWDLRDSLFLIQLDSADTTPPTGPGKKSVTATSERRNVTFRWGRARDGALLGYRVYVDGEPRKKGNSLKFFWTKKRKTVIPANEVIDGKRTVPKNKRIMELGVRAIDRSGNLGPLTIIRFRVGVGIVNNKGKLIRDTVPPSSPRLRGRVLGSGIQLSWNRAVDLGGKVTGYRLERNKRLYRQVGPGVRSLVVPFSDSRGTWTIRAIDNAKPKKNLSPRAGSLTIR